MKKVVISTLGHAGLIIDVVGAVYMQLTYFKAFSAVGFLFDQHARAEFTEVSALYF